MEITAVLWVALGIIFLAGATQGLTGFGFSLVSVPLLVVFYQPPLLVPVIIIHSTLINLILFHRSREHARPRRMWPLLLSGAAGIPLGTYLLLIVDHQLLKLVIGLIIIVFGIAFLARFRHPVKSERAASVPIGLASGTLNGSISMSGPPVIFFFANQGLRKKSFRANLIMYFLFLNLVTLPVFFVSGLFTPEAVGLALALLPAMVVGALTGGMLARRADEALFRKVVLVLVTCAGGLSVLSGVGWI